ncbi:hypothetical protein ACSBR1_026830 [Camellia fascicularis]
MPNTQYLLFTSIYKLESHIIDTLKSNLGIPISSIGPTIPYYRLKESFSVTTTGHNNDINYVQWLDSQPKALVFYMSQGGFWSHCGWNSTKEGVFAGLPFLTYLIFSDQIANSKSIVEDWKIGWKVRRGMSADEHLVTREEIAKLIQRFMDLESVEGKEMRRRAKELQQIFKNATS